MTVLIEFDKPPALDPRASVKTRVYGGTIHDLAGNLSVTPDAEMTITGRHSWTVRIEGVSLADLPSADIDVIVNTVTSNAPELTHIDTREV